ncbi:MAG: hypothetical protein MR949_05940, partial [Veillonellaceae bacterium]|nr:hypothetical protein [Veillonellaceae bacterium]
LVKLSTTKLGQVIHNETWSSYPQRNLVKLSTTKLGQVIHNDNLTFLLFNFGYRASGVNFI